MSDVTITLTRAQADALEHLLDAVCATDWTETYDETQSHWAPGGMDMEAERDDRALLIDEYQEEA